jgi:formylglycine-generating enzyme required for sulfatase activity
MWWCGNVYSVFGAKPVATKLANQFGLFDMHGNVSERCEDDGHSNYIGAPSNGSAWIDTPRGERRVYRNSFWWANAHASRSAFRGSSNPGTRYLGTGFRLAADIP